MEGMTDQQFEDVRTEFFKVASIDLKNLSAPELRQLLTLLPRVQSAILHEYDMVYVWSGDDDA